MIIKIRNQRDKVWVDVPATKIQVPHLLPYKFYVHKSIGPFYVYTVSELLSGAAIAHGDTKNWAIKNAKDRLADRTPADVKRGIDKARKMMEDGEG